MFFGIKKFQCQNCGKTYYRLAGDVVGPLELYCFNCLMDKAVKKITNKTDNKKKKF